MHGFRDNEDLWQARYDVIMISPPGGFHAIIHDEFCKSNYDFLIVIHSNFLYAMNGFWDNEVLLPTIHDVIVSPLPGGAARDFFMTDSERATMTSW